MRFYSACAIPTAIIITKANNSECANTKRGMYVLCSL